jgi:hypothetical protein
VSAFLILMLLLLASRAAASSQPLAAQAAHAQVDATVKQTQAAADPLNPSKRAAATAAQKKADDLTRSATKQSEASTLPKPWPQAMPADLPPFPGSGWEFDKPPPQAVQNRAVQLLPTLWKTGAKSHRTEKTQGRWITYVAEHMGTKRGVVAYRLKGIA